MPNQLPSNPSHVSIREAADSLGVSLKTLRRWEGHGLVHPIRNDQNQRVYSAIEISNLDNRKYKPLPENSIAPQNQLSISQAADELGVSIKTLRRWDAEGKIQPLRDDLNRRIFTPEQVATIKANRSQFSQSPESQLTQDTRPIIVTRHEPSRSFPTFAAPLLSLLPFILVAVPILVFSLLGYKPSVPLQSVSFNHATVQPLNPDSSASTNTSYPTASSSSSPTADTSPILRRIRSEGEVAGLTVTGGSFLSFENILDDNYNFGVAGTVEGNQIISSTTVKAPFIINSQEKVTNLNADLLDGHSWEEVESVVVEPNSLQKSYEAGNTITTTDKNLEITLSGSTALAIGGTGAVNFNTSGQTSFTGNVRAGNGLSVIGNLTLNSVPSGSDSRFLTVNSSSGIVSYVDTASWDKSTTDDLSTSTSYAGDVSGLYNNLQLGSGVVGSTEISDASIAETDLSISNSPVNGYVLQTNGSGALSWSNSLNLGSLSLNGSLINATATELNLLSGHTNVLLDTASVSATVQAYNANTSLLGQTIEEGELTITNGPSNGYFLQTDGSGNLTWADISGMVGGAGDSYLSLTAEQLHPTNTALDFLLGGTSTAAATIALQSNTGNIKATSADISSIRVSGTTVGLTSDTDLLSMSAAAVTVNGTLDVISSITAPTIGTINNLNINNGAVSNAASLSLQLAGNTWDSSGNLAVSNDLTASHLYTRDTNQSNTLQLRWNEDDTANRILDFYLAGANRQLTLNENFTIGNGSPGILTYTNAATLTVEGNANLNQDLTTDASPTFAGLTSTGHILPSTDDTYDLGSATYRWRDLYLGPTSIRMGETGDESSISFDTATNTIKFDADNNGSADFTISSTGELQVGNILTQGNTIGLTSDLDLLTLADNLLTVNGTLNVITGYQLNGADVSQYFVDSAGASGQLWSSDGSGRGGWISPTTWDMNSTDDVTVASIGATVQAYSAATSLLGQTIEEDELSIGNDPSAGFVLQTDALGNLSWADPGTAATNYWLQTGEQIYAKNALWNDLLIGGTSTSAATIALQANTGTIIAGHILPKTNDAFDLGSDAARWKDIFLGGDTLHLGTSLTDEGTLSYNTSTNVLGFSTDSTTNGDIAFFADDLYLDKSTGFLGIGTNTPIASLTIKGANTEGTWSSELLTTASDRDFSSNSGNWTGLTWTIGSDVATHTAGATSFVHTLTPTAGKTYIVEADISTSTPGEIWVEIGGSGGNATIGQIIGTVSNHAWIITTTNTDSLRFTPDATWEGTIDNISVAELTPSDSTLTLQNSDNTTGLELRTSIGSAEKNTFIGINAGKFMNRGGGYYNVALGYDALNLSGYSESNTAIGASTLKYNTYGSYNTALGNNALYRNTMGNYNVGIGKDTLIYNVIGTDNVAIGSGALVYNTVGNENTALGSNAGQEITTGYSNTFIGYNAGSDALQKADAVNSMALGNGAYTTADNQIVLGNNSIATTVLKGNVGIGTTAPSQKLDVVGNLELNDYIYFANGSTDYLRFDGSNFIISNDFLPSANDTYNLGSDAARWKDIFLGGDTLHLGTSLTDESTISYDTTNNILNVGTDSTTNGDIAFFGDDLYLDKSTGYVGIGDTTPSYQLDVAGDVQIQGALILTPQASTALTAEGTVYYDSDVDHLFVRTGDNAFHRLAMDLTKYSVNNTSVANAGYIEIAHNQNTNDLTVVGWVKNTITNLWEKITDKSITYTQSLQNQFDDATASGKIRTTSTLTDVALSPSVDTGTGADGAITVSSSTNINTTNLISGRTCTDGGDAVNYSITALTATTATLSTTPSAGCLVAGDEVLLVNLQGISGAYTNVGKYETLHISNVSTNTITFTSAKTNYYGDNATDDSNIGTTTSNQRVMLQRVPNYTNVTVNSSINFYPSAWNGTKGGVIFFRANGAVSASGTIHANATGYRGGAGATIYSTGGYGGESFCSASAGGNGGYNANGTNGLCGGGGAGSTSAASGWSGGSGSSTGGAGGGGGTYTSSGNWWGGGGGAGAGFGTAGAGGGGVSTGASGGTNSSGNGAAGVAGGSGGSGGGGGGTYTNNSKLLLGSGGGGGGGGGNTGGGTGGAGGGIVYIASSAITVSGGVTTTGATGGTGPSGNGAGGGGGGAAGGSLYVLANTATLGTNLVSAAGGGAGAPGTGGSSNYYGGAGGAGVSYIMYTNSYTGSASSPTPTYTQQPYYPYGLYHSPVINTPNATSFGDLRWEATPSAYGKVAFETRTGNSDNPKEGSWEAWKPMVSGTNYLSLQTANTDTDWSGTNATVAEGDVTRDVEYFEDEDEGTAGNLTKITSSTNGGYAEATITSTDISAYDYLTFWVRASQTGNVLTMGLGESAATEQVEYITIDAVDTWQKVYWDLSDIASTGKDGVTKLRLTNLVASSNTIYLDNIKAEKAMTISGGSTIKSTPNNYFQYRAILTTTNTSYQPRAENISFTYNNGFKTVQTDANTVRLYNYSGEAQDLRLDVVVFGADLAEWYSVENPEIGPGDIVALTGFLDDYSVPILRKATKESGSNIVGVISTKAGQTLGLESPERRLLGLAGRVPVKVASDSGNILPGDFLTASDIPGQAKPAAWGNMIIGKALEPWSADSGKSTVLMLINDPAPYFPILTKTIDQVSTIVEGITLLTNVVIDNLTINSKLTSVSIDTDQFSANTASISGLVAGSIDVATLSAQTIESPVIDVINTELEIISNDVATLSSRVSFLESRPTPTPEPTPTIEESRIVTLETAVASLSASLTTNLTGSQSIDLSLPLEASTAALTDSLTSSPTDSPTNDLNLDVESIFISDFLSVLGDTILTTATITNSLTVSSINSLTGRLSLLGSLLTLDSTGNLVTITGDLAVTGTTTLNQLTSLDATISGILSAPVIDELASRSASLEQLVASLSAQVASLSAQLASPSASTIINSSLTPDSTTPSSSRLILLGL